MKMLIMAIALILKSLDQMPWSRKKNKTVFCLLSFVSNRVGSTLSSNSGGLRICDLSCPWFFSHDGANLDSRMKAIYYQTPFSLIPWQQIGVSPEFYSPQRLGLLKSMKRGTLFN